MPGQAERSGESAAIHQASTPKKAKSSTAARQSVAEMRGEGSEVSPDYDTTQHAHKQKKTSG